MVHKRSAVLFYFVVATSTTIVTVRYNGFGKTHKDCCKSIEPLVGTNPKKGVLEFFLLPP